MPLDLTLMARFSLGVNVLSRYSGRKSFPLSSMRKSSVSSSYRVDVVFCRALSNTLKASLPGLNSEDYPLVG